MAQLFADDYYCDDRRRVVNAGIRRGRDAAIEDLRVAADVGFYQRDVDRHCDPRRTPRPHAVSRLGPRNSTRFMSMSFSVVEIDADERIAAVVVFDVDDIDAAFEELDARYLAGEAAAYAHTWSVIAGGLRRAQPARASRDDAGLGEHRPPA